MGQILRLWTVIGLLFLVAPFPAAQAQRQDGAQAVPPSGGTIAVRDIFPPDCLDPQKTVNGASAYIFGAVVDTLMSEGPHGKLEPDLALKWKASKGGTVLTFFLRHGVRFSNGDPCARSSDKISGNG
jgi:ABC-type transport system substrate-binding protein